VEGNAQFGNSGVLVLKCQWSNASFYYTRDMRQAGALGQIKKIQVLLH